MTAPWCDRNGRVAPLKAAMFVAAFVPGTVIATEWALGALGPRPFNEVTHGTGLWIVRFLLLSLAVSPARSIFAWPRVMVLRRMIGVTALAYGLAHLSLYIVDQDFRLLHVAAEIVRRFYLTIGGIALLGLSALGATSTDAMVRRLGRNWKRLHRLVYPIAALGLLHYLLQAKLDVWEPVICVGLFAWLMAWRTLPDEWQRAFPALLALTVFATLATMGFEVAWYALRTTIDPMRVFDANFSIARGLRPAHWVFIICLGVTALSGIRQATKAPRLRAAERALDPSVNDAR